MILASFHHSLNQRNNRGLVFGCQGWLKPRALGRSENFLEDNLHQIRLHLFGNKGTNFVEDGNGFLKISNRRIKIAAHSLKHPILSP
jgi:hypothetical protein